jgi:hypothetical protein
MQVSRSEGEPARVGDKPTARRGDERGPAVREAKAATDDHRRDETPEEPGYGHGV